MTGVAFQSPHRAYGHSDPETDRSSRAILPSFNLLIELTVIPTSIPGIHQNTQGLFQSPHRAYGHSDRRV